MREVRVRFAPSPTGPLHIGGVRTALYNYLFARKNHGKFILRIEDTDQARFVPGAEEYIIESLNWCGIKIDEGVIEGGPFAPYRQSERKDMYKRYAEQLVESGYAYYAFDTPEELDHLRKEHEQKKESFYYGPLTRIGLKNSLTLTPAEVETLLRSEANHVIRIKIPQDETIIVNDLIRGTVKVDSSLLDDKVLFKSDGMPTYHLANVVDDYLMKISHVIRGEEWLPSAPLHVLLYKYLGWQEYMPEFAHLPLLLRPDGNGKLSKRDGDRLGFPVFPLQWTDPKTGEVSSGYRESGYLPQAFINMLALLGWNPGTEQEIFEIDELFESFSLDRCIKSGAKFDAEKAKWFNHHYIALTDGNDLADFLSPILHEKGIEARKNYVALVCNMVKDRIHLLTELWNQSWFFFQAPESYDPAVVAKVWKNETPALLAEFASKLDEIIPFTAVSVEALAKSFVQEKGIGLGMLMNPFRLTVVGTNAGPGMIDVSAALGKEEIIRRINLGLLSIKVV